jgi:hypothetical protein
MAVLSFSAMSKTETDPKTTTQSPPKASAAAANPFAPFFTMPFTMPFGPEAFVPWLREHAARIEKVSDEISAFERAMIERIKTNAADVAALFQDPLDYVQQVGAEWRKIAVDTARRAADVTGKA